MFPIRLSLACASVTIAASLALPSDAPAATTCRNTTSFEAWLPQFKAEARREGIGPRGLSALDGVTMDPSVISRDRGQSVFAQSFFQFSDRMANKSRMQRGAQLIKKHEAVFSKVEREYGVPAAVITAFWGLETDFGADNGNMSTIRSVATLAWDCRRPEKFRAELLDALRIVDRGDLSAEEMRGPWAGEIGQTQFVPSVYLKYAVDFDGNGKRDLIHSVPDVLASTGNYLRALGWRRGEPWLEEVRVPAEMDWSQADVTIQHPVSKWKDWGVRPIGGQLKGSDDLPASLVLPLGRNGPAFLAYRNFKVYTEWNQSLLYSTTAAYLAARIAGAPAISHGRDVTPFPMEQTKELQRMLAARGYNVGEIDGKLGANTRAAVRDMQKKLGLPADSYPSPELLRRLQSSASRT